MDLRDAVFNVVFEIISKDKNTIVLTDDMGALVLDKIRADFPAQAVNTGISEQNLVSVAGGLALSGKKVFAYGIASHITRRCYEQIALDICSMNLPVVILAVGSGLSYGWDGLTHHSNYDIAYMRALPGIAIYNPSDPISAGCAVRQAYKSAGPAYIRLDRDQSEPIYDATKDFGKGMASITGGKDVTLVATGVMVHRALDVSKVLKSKGIRARVVDLYRIKPLNERALAAVLRGSKLVVTLEDHSSIGGIGDIAANVIADNQLKVTLRRFSLGDRFFLGSANREWVHEKEGLTSESVANSLIRIVRGKAKKR